MLTVVITGLEFFAKRLVSDFKKYSFRINPFYIPPKITLNPNTVSTIWKADIIHFIGGGPFATKYVFKALLLKLLSLKKVLIFHWVGSDILRLKRHLSEGKLLAEVFSLNKNVYHLCEVRWTQEELKELGILAEIIPVVGVKIPTEVSWPQNFSILTYIGNGRETFYGLDEIVHIALTFPNIPITVIGTKCEKCEDRVKSIKNIKFLGWVNNVYKIMQQHPVYVRHVKHDGLSISVLEALALGRHVCYNYPLEGSWYTPNLKELTITIGKIHNLYKQGKLNINQKGRNFVRSYYERKTVVLRLEDFYIKKLG